MFLSLFLQAMVFKVPSLDMSKKAVSNLSVDYRALNEWTIHVLVLFNHDTFDFVLQLYLTKRQYPDHALSFVSQCDCIGTFAKDLEDFTHELKNKAIPQGSDNVTTDVENLNHGAGTLSKHHPVSDAFSSFKLRLMF